MATSRNIQRLTGVITCAILLRAICAPAADLEFQVAHPPTNRTLIAALFDSADTFVDLRDPIRRVTLPPGSSGSGRMAGLPAGEYALVVYQDENDNGRLDRNFIGIPREPMGFSNRYWPQGPPSFARAAFRLNGSETNTVELALRSVFAKRGVLGVGVGIIAQTSPYRDSGHGVVQPIPAISYVGERLQILGPAAQYGLANWRDFRLAATANYRLGAYEEDDSDALRGLGDRDDTLLGGLALQARLPWGFGLTAGYAHDVLDRTGGGSGKLAAQRAFQHDLLTLSPRLALNWLTTELADYEYGVPTDQATTERPAYRPGDAIALEAGIGLFVELPGAWRVIANGGVSFLPSEITASPIVDQSRVYNTFVAITRSF